MVNWAVVLLNALLLVSSRAGAEQEPQTQRGHVRTLAFFFSGAGGSDEVPDEPPDMAAPQFFGGPSEGPDDQDYDQGDSADPVEPPPVFLPPPPTPSFPPQPRQFPFLSPDEGSPMPPIFFPPGDQAVHEPMDMDPSEPVEGMTEFVPATWPSPAQQEQPAGGVPDLISSPSPPMAFVPDGQSEWPVRVAVSPSPSESGTPGIFPQDDPPAGDPSSSQENSTSPMPPISFSPGEGMTESDPAPWPSPGEQEQPAGDVPDFTPSPSPPMAFVPDEQQSGGPVQVAVPPSPEFSSTTSPASPSPSEFSATSTQPTVENVPPPDVAAIPQSVQAPPATETGDTPMMGSVPAPPTMEIPGFSPGESAQTSPTAESGPGSPVSDHGSPTPEYTTGPDGGSSPSPVAEGPPEDIESQGSPGPSNEVSPESQGSPGPSDEVSSESQGSLGPSDEGSPSDSPQGEDRDPPAQGPAAEEERQEIISGVMKAVQETKDPTQVAEIIVSSENVEAVAEGFTFLPEERSVVLVKTPERRTDGDVVTMKAVAEAALSEDSSRKVAEIIVLSVYPEGQPLPESEYPGQTKDGLISEFEVLLKDQTLMQDIVDADPTTQFLPLEGRRRLACDGCTPINSFTCAHCWTSVVCSKFHWCPSIEMDDNGQEQQMQFPTDEGTGDSYNSGSGR